MLHHTGILCDSNYIKSLDLIQRMHGAQATYYYSYLEKFQCHCHMYDFGTDRIEYVVPVGGSLMKRLQQFDNMPSIHHIAYEVDDILNASSQLKLGGVPILLPEPIQGVGNILVNFIRPEYCGIMIELVQCDDKT